MDFTNQQNTAYDESVQACTPLGGRLDVDRQAKPPIRESRIAGLPRVYSVEVLVFLLVLAFLVVLLVVGMASIPWRVHKDMTVEETSQWGRGTRLAFWREFNSHAWEPVTDDWPSSWFERSSTL